MKASSSLFEFEGRTLHHWNLIKRFLEVFDRCHQQRTLSPTETDPRRSLHARDYGAWMLLALFNPVIKSTRALCRLSSHEALRESLQAESRLSLSSFSEAQHAFDPQLWRRVLRELAPACCAQRKGKPFSPQDWLAEDSTLWKVLPRMGWAVWRHQYCRQQALRLQIKVHIGQGLPVQGDITAGNVCERRALRRQLKAGECYLGDAYYSEDYALLEHMSRIGCGWLVRLRSNAVYQVIQTRDLSPTEHAKGVLLDAQVKLGSRHPSGPYRLLMVRVAPHQEPLLLVGNVMIDTLRATEVLALYKRRWQVELFFRWLKCVLPCRHWFAESSDGVSLQIYSAMICALLLAQKVGRIPRVAQMELLYYHQAGMISDEALSQGLQYWEEQYALEAQRREARKNRLANWRPRHREEV